MNLDRNAMSPLEIGVWAAAYVRILSATPPSYPIDDHQIRGVADSLDGTKERRAIAVDGADGAVLALRKALKP